MNIFRPAVPSSPDIALGEYSISLIWHYNKYPALTVNDNLEVKTTKGNSNRKDGKAIMIGCHIHKGGDDWTWSMGCLTVHTSQWNRFISYFPNNPAKWGKVKKKKEDGTIVEETAIVGGQNDYQDVGTLFIM